MPDNCAFLTERDAWTAGVDLLRRLRHLRCVDVHSPVDDEAADDLVREYCRRLRRSDVLLARIQRMARLTDSGIIVVVYAMACFLGIVRRGSTREACLLAHGVSPLEMRRTEEQIRCGRGVGKVVFIHQGQPWPSQSLLDYLTSHRRISAEEAEIFRDDLHAGKDTR